MSEVIRRIDARTSSDADGNNYFVVFCSRLSDNPTTKPGHAFVVWGVEDNQNRRSVQSAYGFYPNPNDSFRALFQTVSGQIVNEANNPSPSSLLTARLIVQVNRQPFTDSQGQIATWRTSDYNLFSRNCIGFARAVAVCLGLFPPDIGTFQLPTSYLENLIRTTTGGSLGSAEPRRSSDAGQTISVGGDFEVDIRIRVKPATKPNSVPGLGGSFTGITCGGDCPGTATSQPTCTDSCPVCLSIGISCPQC